MMYLNNGTVVKAGDAFRSWRRDWGGLLTIALGSFFIFYVIWIFLVQPTEENKTLVTDIAQPLVSLAMTVLAWRTSRQSALEMRIRRAWRIVAVAFLVYCVGNILWAYYELFVGADLAVSWADLPYLMYYPICLAGLLSFPMTRAGRSRMTFALDAGTVMLGATILIWYLVLRPVALAEHASTLEMMITLAYPASNTVLLFGVIAVLLRQPPKSASIALRILTFAILFDAIADFGYSYQTLENTYVGGQWPDCFYMLGFVLMAVSAQYQYRSATKHQTEVNSAGLEESPFSWLPYAAVAVAYGLLLWVTWKFERNHGMEPIVWLTVGAFLITTLVVARQIVALRENARLLKDKAARESEARFTSLIQHASEVITIIGHDGRVNYVSPSVERMFGYKPRDLTGIQLRDLFHAEDRQRVLDTVAAIAEEPGKTCSFELRARHCDQSWVHIEAVMTNLIHVPNVAGDRSQFP